MSNPAEKIIRAMIHSNLVQGWECLNEDQCELAKGHFEEAARQCEELAMALNQPMAPAPAEEQKVLDV